MFRLSKRGAILWCHTCGNRSAFKLLAVQFFSLKFVFPCVCAYVREGGVAFTQLDIRREIYLVPVHLQIFVFLVLSCEFLCCYPGKLQRFPLKVAHFFPHLCFVLFAFSFFCASLVFQLCFTDVLCWWCSRNVATELATAGRNGGGTPEAYNTAVERALEGLEPFRDYIESSVTMQGPLLEEIITENERYVYTLTIDSETTVFFFTRVLCQVEELHLMGLLHVVGGGGGYVVEAGEVLIT